MSFSKNIYRALCTNTSDYEVIVSATEPTTCPVHGGPVDPDSVAIINSNKFNTTVVTNEGKITLKSSAYEVVHTLTLKGVQNAVLRQIDFISKKEPSATSYAIKVFDRTNQQILFENTYTNNDPIKTTIDDTTITNQPYDDAIMEIHMRIIGAGPTNRYVYLTELEFLYEVM